MHDPATLGPPVELDRAEIEQRLRLLAEREFCLVPARPEFGTASASKIDSIIAETAERASEELRPGRKQMEEIERRFRKYLEAVRRRDGNTRCQGPDPNNQDFEHAKAAVCPLWPIC